MRAINLIVVHCSATKPSMDIGVDTIRKWHLKNGWSDVGYHFIIKRDGSIDNGRPVEIAGAHTQGHNSKSIGVCMVGGVSETDNKVIEDNFTDAQYSTLTELVTKLLKDYPAIKRVCGHRDLSPDLDGDGVIEKHEWVKGCPSFSVQDWLNNNNMGGFI